MAAWVFAIGMGLSFNAGAMEEPKVSWENRWSEELGSGDIINHPPFVAVNDIRLYRFSEMQTVTYRDDLLINLGEEGYERLYVFMVWQGGASQGEQLMLLSVRPGGVTIAGPHSRDFETLEIDQANPESAPVFILKGADGVTLEKVSYSFGELVATDD